MSHHALQRALYLALFDDGFVRDLRADPEGVLAPLGLDERERGQLVAVDPRAFRTDPLRRRRALRILADEYKASTTLVMAETRDLSFVEGFFGSRFFRRAVVEGRAFAPAFGAYLLAAAQEGRLVFPQLADVTRLEMAGARARRGAGQAPVGVGLAPGHQVVRVDGSTLETIQILERWLFELGLMPQVALCDRPTLPALPPRGVRPAACYLVTASQLVEIDDDLHRVLAALAEPRARSDAAAALVQAGIPEARAEALLASLIEDGLVVGSAEALSPSP